MSAEFKEDPFSNCALQSQRCLLSANKKRKSVMNSEDNWRADDKVNSGGIKTRERRGLLYPTRLHGV